MIETTHIEPDHESVTVLVVDDTPANRSVLCRQLELHKYGVVSVDSGPMHIAAGISDRLISIHTWSDPRKVGPYAAGAWVWKGGRLQRMGDYDSTQLRDQRGLAEADLEEIAALAKAQLGG